MPKHDPTSIENSVKAAQEQILEGVRTSQEWILESVRNFTETAQQAATPVSDQLPAPVPPAELKKMVDDAFDFTEKLLASQREFTHKLVAASTAPGNGDGDGPAKD